MARGIVKEIEGIIAIVIFISFLTFYLAMYKGYIINNINNYNQISYYNTYINNILNSIETKYYLLSLNVSIPLSMYYQCLQNFNPLIYNNLNNEFAYNDFCTSFPIYYPLNISFLTNYSGVLNNTNNTYLDPNVGIFFYANFTNFNINNNQPQYVLINVSNPSNQPLTNYPVFITSTDIFYWLQNGSNLSVEDLSGNNYSFCYLNNNLNCNSSNNNAYGIWVNLNISPNSYVILNISPINEINSYSVDGKEIFPVYDNFSYQNYQQFSQYWTNNTPINISYMNPGDDIYSCSQYSSILNSCIQYNNFKITYNSSIPKGNYLILFNIQNGSYPYNAYIQLGDKCNINLPSNGNPNSLYIYYCYNDDNNDNLQIYGQNIYAYYINIIPYNVIPNIKIIYQPNLTNNYKFIIGPNLTYDFSQYNDLHSGEIPLLNSNGNFAIYNNNLKYFSYITYNYLFNSISYYSVPMTYLSMCSSYAISLYTRIGFSLYTSEYEPYNLTPYVYNDSLALLYLYNYTNLSIKDIIFSNTFWYIFNTQKYYNSNNMIFWNISQPYYGFVLNSTNFYNTIFDLNNLLNKYPYLYYEYENGIILRRYIQTSSCSRYQNSILYINYNPIINISYALSYDNYNNLYFLNATLNNNYNYQNYYFYLYSNPYLDKQTALYLAFSTQIPYIETDYIKSINVINLNNLINLSENYQNAYFYFNNLNITIFNGTIYQGNIVNNYTYSENFNIYVLNNTMVNTLYKDQLTIYIK